MISASSTRNDFAGCIRSELSCEGSGSACLTGSMLLQPPAGRSKSPAPNVKRGTSLAGQLVVETLKLLLGVVGKGEPAPPQAAGDPDLDSQRYLQLGRQPIKRAPRRRRWDPRPGRDIALHPGLGLAHGQASGEHDLKPVLLVVESGQTDQRPSVAGAQGTAGNC